MIVNLPATLATGDTAPLFEAKFTLKNGKPMNATGAQLWFRMTKVGATTRKVDAQGSWVDAVTGHGQYAPLPEDTDEPGTYRCEFRVIFADGRIATCPSGDEKLILIITDGV